MERERRKGLCRLHLQSDGSQEGFQKRDMISSVVFKLAGGSGSVFGIIVREIKRWRGT